MTKMTMEEIKKYRIITLMRDIIVYPLGECTTHSVRRCATLIRVCVRVRSTQHNIHLAFFRAAPIRYYVFILLCWSQFQTAAGG